MQTTGNILQNRTARFDFTGKPAHFWNKILWTNETNLYLYKNNGKKNVCRWEGWDQGIAHHLLNRVDMGTLWLPVKPRYWSLSIM